MISLILFFQVGAGGGAYSPEYYIFPSQDKVLIEVQLWGHISKPGLYQVPLKTDIIKLISLSGGPLPSGDLSKVKVIRNGKNQVININDMLKGEKFYLEAGDVVIVPQNTSSKFKDYLYFLKESIALFAQIILIYTFLQAQR
ncbi:MAG: SLBB domain-containing protein [candidate division WOR-3 bacterium]